jgi:hypothetical protein
MREDKEQKAKSEDSSAEKVGYTGPAGVRVVAHDRALAASTPPRITVAAATVKTTSNPNWSARNPLMSIPIAPLANVKPNTAPEAAPA